MIPGTGRLGDPARAEPKHARTAGGFRGALGELFPPAPEAPTRTWGGRTLSVAAQVAAVAIAAVVMLLRIPGRPSWDTIYAEDYWQFLTHAIQQPWHLVTYNGYLEGWPQVLAQFVRYLPLSQAAWVFAVTGAVIDACCALFVFHASAGHIKSVKLRALLAVALVLLSATPMEIIDSGVDTPWYMLAVLFWAMVWRPRTRSGMAVAAGVGFITAFSNILAVLLAPVIVARLYVLRRPREHAVSAGWLAGCLVQVPFVISGARGGDSRLAQHATPGQSLAFYGHDVLLPSFGWHLSWWLRSWAGINGATAIAGVVLVVIFGAICVTQPRARLFVVAALGAGFISAVIGISINGKLALYPLLETSERGNRYTVMPIFLIVSAVIVGVDCALRRRARGGRPRGAGLKPAMAVAALVAVLATTWVADFRYAGLRSGTSWNWAPIAAKWEHDCAHSRTGEIVERDPVAHQTLPCRNIST